MKLELTINLDGNAFADDDEVPRLLKRAAKAYRDGVHTGKIYDSNGNLVGHFEVIDDEPVRRHA